MALAMQEEAQRGEALVGVTPAQPANGYSGMSILFHWLSAALVIAIWFAGSAISVADSAHYQSARHVHISIAASAYLLLWARILWRLVRRHPGRHPTQGRLFFSVGVIVHYGLLIAIGLMLVTGPLLAWAGGNVIQVFDWFSIPSPLGERPALLPLVHSVHVTCGNLIILGVLLHVAGVAKHAAIDKDGTFGRMMLPAKRGQ